MRADMVAAYEVYFVDEMIGIAALYFEYKKSRFRFLYHGSVDDVEDISDNGIDLSSFEVTIIDLGRESEHAFAKVVLPSPFFGEIEVMLKNIEIADMFTDEKVAVRGYN